MRNFGMTSPRIVGGIDQSAGPLHGDTLPLLPSQSILDAGRPPLERSRIAQALFDIALMFVCLVILCAFATGVGLTAYAFIAQY